MIWHKTNVKSAIFQHHFSMNCFMSKSWSNKLKKRYKELVGVELNDFEEATVTTHILWIPGCSTWYTNYAQAPMRMDEYTG